MYAFFKSRLDAPNRCTKNFISEKSGIANGVSRLTLCKTEKALDSSKCANTYGNNTCQM